MKTGKRAKSISQWNPTNSPPPKIAIYRKTVALSPEDFEFPGDELEHGLLPVEKGVKFLKAVHGAALKFARELCTYECCKTVRIYICCSDDFVKKTQAEMATFKKDSARYKLMEGQLALCENHPIHKKSEHANQRDCKTRRSTVVK